MNFIHTSKPMSDKEQELMNFFSKWGALGAYILIGLLGKFGLDIATGRRMSFGYVFGSGCVAIFVGWLSWVWCKGNPSLNPGLVVPIATLASRDLALFLTTLDYVELIKLVRKQKKE